MQMSTKEAEPNRSPDLSARDIAAILANPTDAGMDELYEWMDAYEAEHGPQDPRAAQYDELFDLGITGLANAVRMSPHDQVERMLAEQIVATHLAAMDCLRRCHSKNLEQRRENLVHANKLTRAFAMLTRALQRNRAEADDRGVARPSPDAEPLPRERGPLRRQGARQANTMARRFSAEQPHAKAAPQAAEPRGTVESDGPSPKVDPGPVEQPHAQAAGAKPAEQPHAKAAGAPSALHMRPEEVSDRPWADPARWGKDPRAGAGPRHNPMQRRAGAKAEK
jgi:hypothetical protein